MGIAFVMPGHPFVDKRQINVATMTQNLADGTVISIRFGCLYCYLSGTYQVDERFLPNFHMAWIFLGHQSPPDVSSSLFQS